MAKNCKEGIESDLNEKSSLFIKKTIEKLPTFLLQTISHELIPCHDLPFNKNNSQKNENNKYISSSPVPIYFLQNIVSNGKLPPDLIEDLIIKKCKWKKEVENFKRIYSRQNNLNEICPEQLHNGEVTIPKYLAKFAWNLKKDPDKYFDELYNWWYTNGNLNVLEKNNEKILIHVPDVNQKIIDISPIDKIDNFKIGPKIKSLTSADTVYALKSTFANNDIIVSYRQKNTISFNFLSANSEKSTQTQIKNISDLPFTSFDLNKHKIGNLCTTDINKIIKLWDAKSTNLRNSKEIYKITCFKDNSNLFNNWNDIKFVDTNTIAFIDHQNLRLLDIRCSLKQNPCITFRHDLEKCNKFSFLCLSNLYQHMSYIGLYHSVLLTDFRNTKSFVYKWTHMMKSIPFVADAKLLTSNEEVLCFSSQLSNEKMFLLNSSKNVNNSCVSVSIPLFSLEKTLNDLQMKGKCLNSYSLINKRIQYCTSGLALLKNYRDIFILSQNSIGDLFKQKVSKNLNDNDYDTSNVNKLSASMNVSEQTKFNLVVTSMTTMNHIKQYNTKHSNIRSKKNLKSKYKETWKKDVNELKQYVDLLAPTILQAWEIDEPMETEHLIQPSQQTANDKVTTWLNNTNFNEIHSQDSVINTCSEENNIFEGNNSPNINSKLNKTPRKIKKTKYVQGF